MLSALRRGCSRHIKVSSIRDLYIYIYTYIYCPQQTISLYQKTSVYLDTWDTLSWVKTRLTLCQLDILPLSYRHTHRNQRKFTYIYIYIYIYIYGHVRASICVWVLRIYPWVNIWIHTHTHTHTYIYIYIYLLEYGWNILFSSCILLWTKTWMSIRFLSSKTGNVRALPSDSLKRMLGQTHWVHMGNIDFIIVGPSMQLNASGDIDEYTDLKSWHLPQKMRLLGAECVIYVYDICMCVRVYIPK